MSTQLIDLHLLQTTASSSFKSTLYQPPSSVYLQPACMFNAPIW